MNYEQKYKEALERARKLHSEYRTIVGVNIPEEIFPELKESEDERIRKELIEHIKANKSADYVLFKRFSPDDVIAWLEKQGEKLDPDKVIDWIECKAFQGWAEEINIKQIVDKFKKDFGL